MNEDQNDPKNSPETNNTSGNKSTATGDTPNAEPINTQLQDDYYAVDYAKKDVISTVGDGEMHDEGLVGEGEATTDIQTSTERLSDEQDIAEFHNSEQ